MSLVGPGRHHRFTREEQLRGASLGGKAKAAYRRLIWDNVSDEVLDRRAEKILRELQCELDILGGDS